MKKWNLGTKIIEYLIPIQGTERVVEENMKNDNDCKSLDKILKEIHWYEQCDKHKGDQCEHIRCKYSVLSLGQGSNLFCGR